MVDDYAVVVGITRYPELRSLEGPERDADDFCKWLADPTCGNVAPDHVTRIVSSMHGDEPTWPGPDSVEAAFTSLLRKARANGGRLGRRLYIFFAGHGISPDLDPDDAALLMANAARDLPGYHVAGRLYANAFRVEGIFDEIALFMDCCRDDYSRVERRPAPWVPSPSARGAKTKRFYAFATRWGRQARERKFNNGSPDEATGEYRGVFSYALMEALRGNTATTEGRITGAVVAAHIQNRLPALFASPEFERPQFDFEVNDDIVFVEKSVSDGTKSVEITFTPKTMSDVELMGAGIADMLPRAAGGAARQLPAGMYALHEQGTARTEFFQVLGEGKLHVDF